MFEDIKKNDESFVAGNPAKVEDMFGKVDPTPELKSAMASGKLAPVAPFTAVQQGQGMAQQGATIGPPNPLTNLAQIDQWSTAKKPRRGLKLLVSVLGALIVVGAAVAYFFFKTPLSNAPAPAATNTNNNAQVNEQPAAPAVQLPTTKGAPAVQLPETRAPAVQLPERRERRDAPTGRPSPAG